MREIKNNMEIGKVQKQDVKFCGTEKTEPQIGKPAVPEKEIKDFSNPSAEALGRTQVSVNKPDNIKEDIKFGMANPEAISASDKLFDLALSKLEAQGDPNAYEKACTIATSSEAKELLSR